MSPRIAVELTSTSLRAVASSRWSNRHSRHLTVPWDPDKPAAGVAALMKAFGRGGQLVIVVGFDFLRLTRVSLPPAPHAARNAMIALEPQRYFATDVALTTTLGPGTDLAFAASRAWLDVVIDTFATYGTVVRVDPAPLAIARALGAGASGTFVADGATDRAGLITLERGQLRQVRRLHDAADAGSAVALPAVGGLDAAFTAVVGALGADDAGPDGTLMHDEQRRVARRAQWRNTATATIAAAAAIVCAALAFDTSRERHLRHLVAAADSLTVTAQPALAAQQQLTLAAHEAGVIGQRLAARANVSTALAAISSVLPPDVVVLTARQVGVEWQLDGTARNAAALVPLLDADPRFDNVRTLAASARFQDGGRTRESFSIALNARPTP